VVRIAAQKFLPLLLGLTMASTPGSVDAQTLAAAPPMGWNSWDAYGLTIGEADYRANAQVLASLKKHGWSYAVIDMGWYMANPAGDTRSARDFQIDGNGLLQPYSSRFPSSADGAGFKKLSDWVHGQGLKFGFHIMRGIPRDAVTRNTPIAGSLFHAVDAADTSDACGWDDGFWGIRDNEAGQAYYDAMMQLYASWGVDFLKVDCIADHPYKPAEIRMIFNAIKKTGRPIVLSLSPGPTRIDRAAEISRYGQMWRISNDIWDSWHFPYNPKTDGYPSGTDTAFDNLAKWSPHARPGAWPDADMLPFGSLRPSPGMGKPRDSGLTQDEARTQFTLWAIARSPLILGTNLTQLDPFTRSLITNDKVIAINQTAWSSRPVTALPPGLEQVRVWEASAGPPAKPVRYVAFFNLADRPVELRVKWQQLGIAGKPSGVELWSGAKSNASEAVELKLLSHASAVYQLSP
jgi:hypothetical protein